METKITTITFDTRISSREITAFRAAVADMFSDEDIYHNHSGVSVLYRYPRIQYKFIQGRISIVGIGDGASSVEKNFSMESPLVLNIWGKKKTFNIVEKKTSYYVPQSFETDRYHYLIRNWLPLNQENHLAYLEAESLADKIKILDEVLSANILSLFKGFDYQSGYKSVAHISEIVKAHKIMYKDVEMVAFDVRMSCNARLPELCGLGKGAGRGFGTIYNTNARKSAHGTDDQI